MYRNILYFFLYFYVDLFFRLASNVLDDDDHTLSTMSFSALTGHDALSGITDAVEETSETHVTVQDLPQAPPAVSFA